MEQSCSPQHSPEADTGRIAHSSRAYPQQLVVPIASQNTTPRWGPHIQHMSFDRVGVGTSNPGQTPLEAN